MADADVPSIGKIYWQCYQLQQHVENFTGLPPTRRKQVEQIVRKRWEMLHGVIHAAGYVLDPEFQAHAVTGNEEVMKGFMTVIERLLPDPDQQV